MYNDKEEEEEEEWRQTDRIIILSILLIGGWTASAIFMAWFNPIAGLVYVLPSAAVIYIVKGRWWKTLRQLNKY